MLLSSIDLSNGSLASHGVAHVGTHSHVASQGTGLVNVLDADMAMNDYNSRRLHVLLVKSCLANNCEPLRKGSIR
jgi:hypothetical protein